MMCVGITASAKFSPRCIHYKLTWADQSCSQVAWKSLRYNSGIELLIIVCELWTAVYYNLEVNHRGYLTTQSTEIINLSTYLFEKLSFQREKLECNIIMFYLCRF